MVGAAAVAVRVPLIRNTDAGSRERLRLAVPLAREQRLPSSSSVALSRDGARVAYVVTDSTGSALFVHSLRGGAPTRIEAPGVPVAPFFSPDGSWVGFLSAGQLRRGRVADGRSFAITPAVAPLLGPTWTESDTIVYSDTRQTGLKRVPAEGGTSVEFLPLGPTFREQFHAGPHVLPGGPAIVFTIRDERTPRQFVWTYDFRTGEKRRLVQGTSPQYVEPGFLVAAQTTAGPLAVFPFDLDQLAITVEAVSLPPTIETGAVLGRVRVSASGNLLYSQIASPSSRELFLLDHAGTPDGESIVFGGGRAGIPGEIRSIPARGGVETVLFGTPDWSRPSSFSPDGSLVYSALDDIVKSEIVARPGSGCAMTYQVRVCQPNVGATDSGHAGQEDSTHEPGSDTWEKRWTGAYQRA